LTLRKEKSYENRKRWHRFSSCPKCNAILMAYLEKGRTYEEVKQKLQEKHHVKYIDQFTKNAIRSATGIGIYDDWIVEHNFWKVRSPLLTKDIGDNGKMREMLETVWKERADLGRDLIKSHELVKSVMTGNDEIVRAFRVMGRVWRD